MAKTVEQFIQKLEEVIKEFKGTKTSKVQCKAEIGNKFELLGLTWKVIDITEKGCMCLAEKLEKEMKFDSSSNDWKTSDLRKYLNEDFYEKLAKEVGEENIVPFERDLLSLDGQTEYGTCEDKVSLLTFDEYRKYRKEIPNTKDYWWWLITPDSTKCNGDETWVCVVASSGVVDGYSCDDDFGVRPFCIFSSSIFESEGCAYEE